MWFLLAEGNTNPKKICEYCFCHVALNRLTNPFPSFCHQTRSIRFTDYNNIALSLQYSLQTKMSGLLLRGQLGLCE